MDDKTPRFEAEGSEGEKKTLRNRIRLAHAAFQQWLKPQGWTPDMRRIRFLDTGDSKMEVMDRLVD